MSLLDVGAVVIFPAYVVLIVVKFRQRALLDKQLRCGVEIAVIQCRLAAASVAHCDDDDLSLMLTDIADRLDESLAWRPGKGRPNHDD